MVTCFRVVRKLGLGPAFLDSKTRIYYVIVERKSPHCKPQNSSKDRQSPGGPAKEGTPYSIFLAATTQTIGCSQWVTEQSRHWSGMRDDWSFLWSQQAELLALPCLQGGEKAMPGFTPGQPWFSVVGVSIHWGFEEANGKIHKHYLLHFPNV